VRRALTVFATAVAIFALALAVELAPSTLRAVVAPLVRHELTHLVLHSLLYAALGYALIASHFSDEAMRAPRLERIRRWLSLWTLFAIVAVGQELAQVFARGRAFGIEELLDLGVDAAAALVGFIVWARRENNESRETFVGRALGVWVHPALVSPLAAFALVYSMDAGPCAVRRALGWTVAASVPLVAMGAAWLVGLRRRWFSDRDLSQRAERPAFLLAGVVVALAFTAWVERGGSPQSVRAIAIATLIATVTFAVATSLGLKASGHAAVPSGVAALIASSSPRGVWPFTVLALVVSWGRVREKRHTRVEVLSGAAIAIGSALLAHRWVAR
jgi:hypothetical protein